MPKERYGILLPFYELILFLSFTSEKKKPKPKQKNLISSTESSFVIWNNLRSQQQPDHEKVGTEHFIMIHDNENTVDSYQWIFNNTRVYSSAVSYMTIRNKHIFSDYSYAML